MPRFVDIFPEMSRVLEKISTRASGSIGEDDDDPWLRVVRAILHGTDARKRERAVQALRENGLTSPGELAKIEPIELIDLLRDANAPIADRDVVSLIRVAAWLTDRHDGDVGSLALIETDELLEEISTIPGIGRSSAESISLFGLGRAVPRFDRAAVRIFVRHGWLDASTDPEEYRSLWQAVLEAEPVALADWADKLDAIGRDYCKVSVAKCERCPLRPFLPDGGPLGDTSD